MRLSGLGRQHPWHAGLDHLTTFRLGVGDHETDVFITLAAAYRGNMPARQGVIGRVAPGSCTKSKSDPLGVRIRFP